MAKKIEVFASEAQQGELENFPDIKRGWGITKSKTGGIPPMKWYNAIQKRTDEAINQVAKESINGYTFKDGGVADSQNDWFEYKGNFYYRKSGFPHAVEAGKTPEYDGGIYSEATPDGLWVDIGNSGDAVLKSSKLNIITDGQLRIGTAPVSEPANSRDTFVIARKINGLSDSHSIRAESVLDEITDYGGHGTFDVATTFRGTGRDEKGFDHHYAFQNRFKWEGTTNIGTIGGYLGRVDLTGVGTVQRILEISIEDFKGTSPVKEHYGIRMRPLEKADKNYSLVSEGASASMIHAGVATFGHPLVPPTGERGVHFAGNTLKGTTQVGVQSSGAANVDAKVAYVGFLSRCSALTGVNLPDAYNIKIENGGKGAGSVIQRYTGIMIDALSTGESNRAIQSLVSKEDKNWNLFIHGEAQNYIAGNVGIGNHEITRNPKARMHILGGTADTPALKLEQGALLATPSNGAFEFEGSALFFTIGGVRYKVGLTPV